MLGVQYSIIMGVQTLDSSLWTLNILELVNAKGCFNPHGKKKGCASKTTFSLKSKGNWYERVLQLQIMYNVVKLIALIH